MSVCSCAPVQALRELAKEQPLAAYLPADDDSAAAGKAAPAEDNTCRHIRAAAGALQQGAPLQHAGTTARPEESSRVGHKGAASSTGTAAAAAGSNAAAARAGRDNNSKVWFEEAGQHDSDATGVRGEGQEGVSSKAKEDESMGKVQDLATASGVLIKKESFACRLPLRGPVAGAGRAGGIGGGGGGGGDESMVEGEEVERVTSEGKARGAARGEVLVSGCLREYAVGPEEEEDGWQGHGRKHRSQLGRQHLTVGWGHKEKQLWWLRPEEGLLVRQADDGIGEVEVLVIQASSLLASDPDGFSDPFIQLQLGDVTVRTQVKRGTLNPLYNEAYMLEFPLQAAELKITVFDWDPPDVEQDIGRATVRMDALELHQTMCQWHTLMMGTVSAGQVQR